MSKSNKNNLNKEVVTQKSLSYGGYGAGLSKLLPRVDKLLRKKSNLAEAFEDTLNDPHLFGLIKSRKAGVLSLEWAVNDEEDNVEIAPIITALFEKHYDIYKIIDEILNARLYGIQPIELTWDNIELIVEGKKHTVFAPVKIIAKPFQNFGFDKDYKLLFIKDEMDDGIELHEDKFLLPRSDASFLNPYGVGLLSLCFWNVYFKKHGKDYWAEFCERFGLPWIIATKKNTTNPLAKPDVDDDEIRDEIQSMTGSGFMLKTENLEIETEFGNSATPGDTYENFINDSRKENSIIILGHESASQSTPGKLGADTNSLEVAKRIIDEDKRLVENEINKLISLIVKYNFENKPAPRFHFFEEEAVQIEKAQRDKLLFELGFKPTLKYITTAYNFKEGDWEEITEKKGDASAKKS